MNNLSETTPIFFLEVPHRGDPRCVQTTVGGVISLAAADDLDVRLTTLREHLAAFGYDSVAEAREDDDLDLATAVEKGIARFGLDTPVIYIGDGNGRQEWQAAPADDAEILAIEFDEARTHLGRDLSASFFLEESEVAETVNYLMNDGPRIGQCGPVAAAQALKAEQAFWHDRLV